MLLARQAASLDALSDGRLTLAVAAGWAESEFEAAGAGDRFAVRGQVLDEAIRALRVLWTETPAEFSGRQISFPQSGLCAATGAGGRHSHHRRWQLHRRETSRRAI